MKKAVIFLFAALTVCSTHRLCAKTQSIKTIAEFEELKQGSCPMVVKFFTPWCQACTMTASDFLKVSDDPRFSHIKFVTVNADHAVELSDEKKIREVPTFLFIVDGKIKSRTVGVKNPETFQEFLIERIERKLPARKKVGYEGAWENVTGFFDSIVGWIWDVTSKTVSTTKGFFGL